MRILVLLFVLVLAAAVSAQTLDRLQPRKVKAEMVDYRGKKAIHLTPAPGATEGENIAIVAGSEMQDGTIEVDLAGAPAAGAMEGARGFIGIAFRLPPQAPKFELFYLRPTNGRADDQLRRNHSTQYVSLPDWPWQRTRSETPGLYESYVDLEPGVWTPVKIVVSGSKARLYVNGAAQPCLIVNDLKIAPASGTVAFWVGPGTDGYFANLKVTPQR